MIQKHKWITVTASNIYKIANVFKSPRSVSISYKFKELRRCKTSILIDSLYIFHLKKTNGETTPSFAISWINGDIRNKMIWNGRLLSDCCCCLHVPDSPLLMRLTMIVSDKNISEFRALSCAQEFCKNIFMLLSTKDCHFPPHNKVWRLPCKIIQPLLKSWVVDGH